MATSGINAGNKMNGLLTLGEAAKILGITTVRPDRTVRYALERVEATTGVTLLVARGEGRARRYMVIERELHAVLGPSQKKRA
jgi:hypothetical protein